MNQETWSGGLEATGDFTFHEEENEFSLNVPGLFITMDNEAQFENHEALKTGLNSYDSNPLKIGGADITLDQSSVLGGVRALSFTHHATLTLGEALDTAATTIGYQVTTGDGPSGMSSDGPVLGPLEDTIDVTFAAANTADVSTATLKNVSYVKQGGETMTAGCTGHSPLFAWNEYGPVASDAWPDFNTYPLVAGIPGAPVGINVCSNDTFSAEVDSSLLGSDMTFAMRFRYGENAGDAYWMMSVDAGDSLPYIPVFSGVFVKFKAGGLGWNMTSETILADPGNCNGPDGKGLNLGGTIAVKVVDENVLTGDATLGLSLGDPAITVDLTNISLLSIKLDGTTGHIRLDSNGFYSNLEVNETFFYGAVELIGGQTDIKLTADEWFVNVGTEDNRATATLFGFAGSESWFTINSSGLDLGMRVTGCDFDKTIGSFGLDLEGYMEGTMHMNLPTLGFTGTLIYEASGAFITPIHDFDLVNESLSVSVGCCSPPQLNFSWHKRPCIAHQRLDAGFNANVLPEFDFGHWAHHDGLCAF